VAPSGSSSPFPTLSLTVAGRRGGHGRSGALLFDGVRRRADMGRRCAAGHRMHKGHRRSSASFDGSGLTKQGGRAVSAARGAAQHAPMPVEAAVGTANPTSTFVVVLGLLCRRCEGARGVQGRGRRLAV
jgi:hypothetical protein